MESMNSESNLSESPNFGGQIVLVLVGLVASGKVGDCVFNLSRETATATVYMRSILASSPVLPLLPFFKMKAPA